MIMTEGKQQKEPPYGDFMRITRKGLSWAENLCQQVEELCTENDFVKNPSRCVDAVGEHLMKMLDNLIHDMENEIDDEHDVAPFSDISLGHGAMLEDFERKRTKLDGIALDEELSTCEDMKLATFVEDLSLKHENVINIMKNNAIIVNLDSSEMEKSFYSEDDSPWEDEDFTKIWVRKHLKSSVSYQVSNISGLDLKENVADKNVNCLEQNLNVYFVEDPNQATFSNEHKLLSEKDTTDKFKGTLTAEGEGLNCSVSRGKSYESFYDEIIAYQMESVSSSSQSLSSISDESILPGSQSSFQLVFVDPKHQEKLFSLETCESWRSPQKGPEKLKTCVTSRNCENLNTFSREEEFSNHSFSFVEADDTNDFECVEPANDFAVRIEASWDEILKHEISLISSQVDKRLSCKKILKRMLSSRLRLSSDSTLEKYHDDLQSQASLCTDWVLL